ncbi:MAG: hypothetical protein JWQ34_2418 [Mucilaginibacter sp.]|uniref:alpha/beta hydrolase n=1 Tax=Mucilaginibacter sp. TaxID=1882438 RepID=UPI002635C897|nr:alpha/beta hydrolase-fold protein [Mucilaginibacter sp.]MDB5004193.1 hypothetical protein [Mucilaginibacter sp.]
MKFRITLILFITRVLLSSTIIYAQQPDTATARYEAAKLEIPQLKRLRTIRIYLPKSYTTSHKKYPVIYMQDGQSAFSKGAKDGDNWYADSLVNLMPADKQCIIVAIHSGNNSNRMNEYNPYLINNEGAIYAHYVAKIVKPYIDSNYRTKKDPKYSVVVGSSMGGLITLYIAARYSNIFGVAGVFSPAFWYSAGAFDAIVKQPISLKSKFFFACGDAEGNEIAYVNRMDTILLHKKFVIKNVPAPLVIKGGKHDEKQWRIAFEAFYRWFTDNT